MSKRSNKPRIWPNCCYGSGFFNPRFEGGNILNYEIQQKEKILPTVE